MKLFIPEEVIALIREHGEQSYPEEGAGFLLGRVNGDAREVTALLPLLNAREDEARHNRYLITPQDMLRGEQEAASQGVDVIGVFHSHPDHPARPSEFDREWALPWFSYIITSVQNGRANGSCSWRLADDRQQFLEEQIEIVS